MADYIIPITGEIFDNGIQETIDKKFKALKDDRNHELKIFR